MLANSQAYEVEVKFTFEPPVYDGDPDDIFELAELEKKSVVEVISKMFDEAEISSLEIAPVIPTVSE